MSCNKTGFVYQESYFIGFVYKEANPTLFVEVLHMFLVQSGIIVC